MNIQRVIDDIEDRCTKTNALRNELLEMVDREDSYIRIAVRDATVVRVHTSLIRPTIREVLRK